MNIKTWQERTAACEAPRHHDFYTCMMQAEIDELRARNSFLQGQLEGADLLLKERDALRVDAERYRWLREQDDSSPLFCMYGSNGPWGECGHSDIYGELLDKSIDEEMKGKS